ncbi:Sugar transferase [Devosia sp. LC5]|nr:Sugar transferase [Devosia sp. LC5]
MAIYILVMWIAGRTDWHSIILVAVAASLIPAIASSLLIVGARLTHPFTMTLLVTMFAACLVVAVVSAFRIPISYIAIALTLPSSLFFVTFGNISMVRKLKRSVALLAFDGAQNVQAAAGWPIAIVSADDVEMRFRKVLIDPVAHHTPEWATQLARLYLRGLEIEGWPTYLEGALGRVDLESFDLSDVSYSPAQIAYYRLKRILDMCGVLVLGIPAAVACGLIWLYIRAVDGGPSIFVQQRRGYGGSAFNLYKFRTMRKDAGPEAAQDNDTRILPGCHLLRQLRLDELPQLYNIWRGEMSFIGPRPVSVPIAEALEAQNPLYVNRQILLPGLTGWAQVSHGYAGTEDEEIEKLAYDLYYLKHVSLDLDIIIIFRTIKTVLTRAGAR